MGIILIPGEDYPTLAEGTNNRRTDTGLHHHQYRIKSTQISTPPRVRVRNEPKHGFFLKTLCVIIHLPKTIWKLSAWTHYVTAIIIGLSLVFFIL